MSKVCPSLGHCVPTAWALTPQALGIGAPRLEHVLIMTFLISVDTFLLYKLKR